VDQMPLRSLEQTRKVYSVSEINAQARDLLESSFFDVCVEGEVSNLRAPGSGHLYFTLKDAASQIAAVLFRVPASQLRFSLEDGMKVVARGRISLYEPRGTYQLICQWLEPAGRGSLQLAFEQLKRKLEAEGLFETARKRPIPALPQRIGLITSPSGAALRDFLHVLLRRYANVEILLHPVRVQGDEAAAEIVEAIGRMNRRGGLDVLVLSRGGGSLEDLWPFNEEIVARAVVASAIPVISAVGHEIDFTICDFACDLRAATPSAAAEIVVRSKRELEDRILAMDGRLRSALRLLCRDLRDQVARLGRSRALLSARARVDGFAQRLDDARAALGDTMRGRVSESRRRLEVFREATSPRILAAASGARRLRVENGLRFSDRAMRALVGARRERWRSLSSILDSLSPLAVLDRGYALCLDPDSGSLVTDTHSLPASRRVSVRLRSGRIGCEIREVAHGQDEEERP